MARFLGARGIAIAAVVVALFAPMGSAAHAAEGCGLTAVLQCPTQSGANAHEDTVHGWLLAPDHGETAQASAKRHGCADCSWTVTTKCVMNSGYSGPDGDHCAGQYVGCEPLELRYLVYLSTPESGTQLVTQYCRGESSGVVSEATVLPDIHSYIDQLSVARPTISSWPPGGAAIVNLPSFFAASPAIPGQRQFGGAGFTMNLDVAPATYEWAFGDGTSMSTTEPGSPPPSGAIRHTYAHPGRVIARLTVSYEARYSVQTPFGQLGPMIVPGGPVVSAPAEAVLDVLESLATLTH